MRRSWETLIEPLAEMGNDLSRAWYPVSQLNAVMNSESLRAAYTACLPKLSNYSTELGQNERLYAAYEEIAGSPEALSADQQKVLENALRDFRLSGVDLPPEKRQRFREISEELSSLCSDFSNKVLDATNAWSRHLDDATALAGLPESAIALAAQSARERGLDGYLLTLDAPCYLAVMTYADDPALREELQIAYNTRASDHGPHAGQFDNSENMEKILALRHEQAQLLGYANYAERSLATKMADSSDEVMKFLTEMGQRSRAQAEAELDEIRKFAAMHHQREKLEAWDTAYYAEKLRKHLHNITEQELKPYFPAPGVIAGMFRIAGQLFDVRIEEGEAEVYHPDVTFYEVRDGNGELRAQFYFDIYARQNKRGGAWMAVAQSRMKTAGVAQIPVAYMTCNFSPPVDGKTALLTHREVETLFHEFGHGLHHMLTKVDHPDISGISGVAWDAVELPSQFMENYCWEREALDLFAAHHETGERLPEDLYQRMIGARNFGAGMATVRQLEFALFDFRLHLEYDPERGGRIYEILQEVREQVAVMDYPDWNRFPHAFSHIFAGGYAAGYYSYKWAELLSADAFSRFEEEGVFNAATGEAFRKHILERGGAEDAMDLFVAFRGRRPTVDALLRHSGIAA
jgi:oligopeptidase A